MQIEHAHLLALSAEGFSLAEDSFPRIDGKGCVRVRNNFYSAPVKAGTSVRASVGPAYVEVWHDGRCVARHERGYGNGQQFFNLEHYLEVLERKPGALAGSKPLEQWRQQGRWPTSYDQFWQTLIARHGRKNGTREMVELLLLGREHGYRELDAACQQALDLGCSDAAAARYLMTAARLGRPAPLPIEVAALRAYERPLPEVNTYDALLTAEGV